MEAILLKSYSRLATAAIDKSSKLWRHPRMLQLPWIYQCSANPLMTIPKYTHSHSHTRVSWTVPLPKLPCFYHYQRNPSSSILAVVLYSCNSKQDAAQHQRPCQFATRCLDCQTPSPPHLGYPILAASNTKIELDHDHRCWRSTPLPCGPDREEKRLFEKNRRLPRADGTVHLYMINKHWRQNVSFPQFLSSALSKRACSFPRKVGIGPTRELRVGWPFGICTQLGSRPKLIPVFMGGGGLFDRLVIQHLSNEHFLHTQPLPLLKSSVFLSPGNYASTYLALEILALPSCSLQQGI